MIIFFYDSILLMSLPNKYLELLSNNKIEDSKLAEFNYTGVNIIDDTRYSKCVVWRWKIKSMNYPLFYFKILDPSKYQIEAPPDVSIGDIQTILPNNSQDYFMTSLQLTLKITDTTTNSVEYRNTPIYWDTNKQYAPYGLSYDSNGYISENTILNNSNGYFWGRSTNQLLNIMSNALSVVSNNNIIFVKNGKNYSILTKMSYKENKKIELYFSSDLRRLFNFEYSYHDELINLLNNAQETTILDTDYVFVNTISENSDLFPFTTVKFSSVDFPVFKYTIDNSSLQYTHEVVDTISAYDLTITDLDIGNSIEFVTETQDRCLSLTDNGLGNFTMKATFVSSSGLKHELILKKGDFISMLCMFF